MTADRSDMRRRLRDLTEQVSLAEHQGDEVRAESLRAEMRGLLSALAPKKQDQPKRGNQPIALSVEDAEVQAAIIETCAQSLRDERNRVESLFLERLQEWLETRARAIASRIEERVRLR
jgi:hypothetical protein